MRGCVNLAVVLFVAGIPAFRSIGSTAMMASAQQKLLHWRVDHPMGPIDWTCPGIAQQMRALSCAAVEARFLNRTLVLPSTMCIKQQRDGQTAIFHEPIQPMLDLDALRHCLDFVLDTDGALEPAAEGTPRVREVTRFHVKPEELKDEPARLLVRTDWHKTPNRLQERMAFPCQGRPVRAYGIHRSHNHG